MAHQVKFVLGKVAVHQPSAIVNAPVDSSECQQECHSKSELESACLVEASYQFTQANDTPFLISLLLEIFGKIGVHSKAFNAIVDGTFVPPNKCAQYTKKSYNT